MLQSVYASGQAGFSVGKGFTSVPLGEEGVGAELSHVRSACLKSDTVSISANIVSQTLERAQLTHHNSSEKDSKERKSPSALLY
jgi:hypothetical protein